MPNNNLQNIKEAIKGIQDIGIMLAGANEYVCEGNMLKRFSRYIEANLQSLDGDIASLKREFPGKFPETPESDSSLSKIRDIAKMLKGKNADVEAKCRAGNLGNELATTAIELRSSVRDIEDTVSGKVSGYSVGDRITDYGGRVTSSLSSLSALGPKVAKIILAALLVTIGIFGYLFFTMESEDALLQSIRNDLAFKEQQGDTLANKRQEYKETQAKIKALDQKDLIREDKIKLLSLSVEASKLRESMEKTTVSIEKKEKEVAEKNKRLEEVRKKTFLQRLLRS